MGVRGFVAFPDEEPRSECNGTPDDADEQVAESARDAAVNWGRQGRRHERRRKGENSMTDKADVKTFPVPRPLATPTDLSPEGVQKITEAVNPLVADAFALYLKTKNFHWHLSGACFRDIHLLLDEHADAILGSTDPLAERVRRISGTTVRSVSHVSGLQTIGDGQRRGSRPRRDAAAADGGQ